MITAITYLGLMVALVYHLITDLHKRKVGHPIIHWLGALITFGISAGIGFINQIATRLDGGDGYQWWQFTIYSLCIHFALFDPIWNLANKNPWYYAGDPNNPNGAWTDKMWRKAPPIGQLLFRPWFIIFGILFYYHLDLILGR